MQQCNLKLRFKWTNNYFNVIFFTGTCPKAIAINAVQYMHRAEQLRVKGPAQGPNRSPIAGWGFVFIRSKEKYINH